MIGKKQARSHDLEDRNMVALDHAMLEEYLNYLVRNRRTEEKR